jgi:hypothetical protein
MAQKLFEDKIGTLSHNTGTISLAASRLTIGGQQYVTSSLSRTIVSDISMSANTLYMIYAVLNSGVVELRYSSNVNSVGPAGFTYWKLVGAFYANGMSPVAFGSFVTIEGVPTTLNYINYIPTLNTTGGGAITLNATSKIDPSGRYMRRGSNIHLHSNFRNGTGGAATGNAGAMLLSMPSGLSFNGPSTGDGNFGSYVGHAGLYDGASLNTGRMDGVYFIYNATDMTPVRSAPQTSSGVNVSDIIAQFSCNIWAEFIPTGWTNTPLKDL